VLKPFFKNKTGNRFVKTSYLLVIGLLDVMCHKASSYQKVASWKTAAEVKHGFIIILQRRSAWS